MSCLWLLYRSYSTPVAAYNPVGGHWDINLPNITSPLPLFLYVQTMPRWRVKLGVTKLWQVAWTLVPGGGYHWGVYYLCAQHV